MQHALVNCTLISNGEYLKDKAVIIAGQHIQSIVNIKELPEGIATTDLHGAYLSAGFIDLQIMGAGGALFSSLPSVNGLEVMEKELLKEGTVGFLPTIPTNVPQVVDVAIKSSVEYRPHALGNFLGLHIEGPYLNPNNRGAHPEELVRKGSMGEVKGLIAAANGEVKMMTIAPELQDQEVLDYLADHQVVLAMGHSGATYEEALHFLKGKKKAVTHLFNGMSPMHHRKPGLIPAVFDQKPYASIVADGIHVAYPMIKMAKQIMGDSLYLISDAATPADEGNYKHTYIGDRYVTKAEDGTETLSGSSLTMLKAVQNVVEHADIELAEAINMATLYPARVLGLENEKGLIQAGHEAGLVAFNRNYEITHVIFKGESISFNF